MGNSSSQSKSPGIISRVFCCSAPSARPTDLRDTVLLNDNIKSKYSTLIQANFRGYLIRKKYNMKPNDFEKLCQVVDTDYSTEKYENNPKIIRLQSLLPKFELNEKEKFLIESSLGCKHVALSYFDGSLYKGFINAKWHREGYGILYTADNSIYEGFFKDNHMEGRGRLYSNDGYVYDGEFYNNMFNGFGKLISLDGVVYRGTWKNDKQSGYGEETYIDGSSYSGYFINGKKNGKGKFTWKNENNYEGNFVNDELNGFGVYRWKDGKIYGGNWINHKMEGVGLFRWPDKKKYIGNYKNDMKSGFGIFYSTDGKRFEGFWKEGKQHGKGCIVNNERRTYVEYYEGKKIKVINEEKEAKEVNDEIEKAKSKIDIIKYIQMEKDLIGNVSFIKKNSIKTDSQSTNAISFIEDKGKKDLQSSKNGI